jgi:hypothetical protein
VKVGQAALGHRLDALRRGEKVEETRKRCHAGSPAQATIAGTANQLGNADLETGAAVPITAGMVWCSRLFLPPAGASGRRLQCADEQTHAPQQKPLIRNVETRRSVPLMAIPLLILFTESLDVRFAVRIEEFLAALLPRRFEFGRCDVPVRPAFLGNGT